MTVRLPEHVWEAVEARRLAEGRSFSQMQVRLLEAALREPGIPVSAGGAREDGALNTSFQASTSGSRSADPHFKPDPKGGKS